MPNKYQRKVGNNRGNWSEESLKKAINAVKKDGMSVFAASNTYKIPRKTLERRIKSNNDKKGRLGPSSFFGEVNERILATHIKEMQGKGFPISIGDMRIMAYKFAEQLNLKHRFNKQTKKAGYDWVQLFLSRNPDIEIKKSEKASVVKATAMNKLEVEAYFSLLLSVLLGNNPLMTPESIFDLNEPDLQLDNISPEYLVKIVDSEEKPTETSTEN